MNNNNNQQKVVVNRPSLRSHFALFLAAAVVGLIALPLYAQPGGGGTPEENLQRFKIRNLGPMVNTTNIEYAPTITADGRTLYFVSDRPGGIGGHDFWYTTKAGRLDTIFTPPVNLAEPVDTDQNEGVASIAADGQTIFFTGCDRNDGLGDCDLYEAELEGTEWKNVRNVEEINSSAWDSQPALSSDGKTLYFVSTREGAMGPEGDADIYVTTKGSDGRWAKPRNVGPPINTTEREDSPFLFPGGKVLYFASAGHGGLGGLDFFSAKLNADGTWGEPENMGEPFNTERDERFITLPAAGDIVYFASERNHDTDKNQGQLDIFMGLLPPRTVTVLVAGRVYDQCTDKNLPADLVFIDHKNGDTIQAVKTNFSTGNYSFVINAEGAMSIDVYGTSDGYSNIVDTIQIPKVASYTEFRKDFPLGMPPTLAATYDISKYVANLPETAPAKYRNFRGLLIEENLVKELYPLLTYVFFDSGSATIPDRYILFKSPDETRNFSDSSIPGGTLQKYYHMLNIVGYRMRSHPDTKIEIVGNNSEQPDLNEVMDVSKQRGQIVYDYLINIWQIDPSRITLLPPRNFPKFRSNPKDPLGIVENRRTEILSEDWEIMKPILQTDFRRYPQPESMLFQMKNGLNDALVDRRAIEIKRNGKMWHVMENVGKTDAVSPAYFWGEKGSEEDEAKPTDEAPYQAQLVIYDKDGHECRSNIVEIPILIVSNELKRRERLVDSTIDRYSLVLFKFDSPEAGPLNERILKEYIYDDIRPGAKVLVTGYTDVVGLDDRNLKLSKDRSNTVVNGLKKNVKGGLITQLFGQGVGETSPLYRNDIPEGRFYNRTVQVVISTPSGTDNP